MKIFIIGGGFAGIKAAKELSKNISNSHEVYLINEQAYTTMLPNLPEIVSGRLKEKDITENISALIPGTVKFLQEKVVSVNFDERKISTKDNEYSYDYLIFAAGSKTNYFGFNDNLDKVNILESLESAKNLREKFLAYLNETDEANLVISGAGFTGIELACNLYDLCKKEGKTINVTMVELGKRLLPMLSQKAFTHISDRLNRLKFNIYTENQIKSFDGKNVTLRNGEIINNAFFCWCSGVRASLKPIGDYEALPDGRILVDKFLAIPKYPEVYVAGDAAAIKDEKGNVLRRAVTFSEESGKHAGKNIAFKITEKEVQPFKPLDLGWIIPMYITSVGEAFGLEVKGRIGIFMHYVICGLKNYSLRNFLVELKAAIKYPFAKL